MIQFLIPIIAFAGIFVGALLKYIAREEVKFGKYGPKYFVWMKRIILFLLILIILNFYDYYIFLIIGILIGLILGIFLTEYLFLNLVMILGFKSSKNILLVLSTLVFLYGLPYGSILRRIKLEQIVPVVLLFFIPFLLLFFNFNLSLIIGIASGGLFQYLIRK